MIDKILNQRDISIDILKFFAVLLITNSHMELLYGKYSMLATGGGQLVMCCSSFAQDIPCSWVGKEDLIIITSGASTVYTPRL